MTVLEKLNNRIAGSGGLIASRQPIPNSPLNTPEIVADICPWYNTALQKAVL